MSKTKAVEEEPEEEHENETYTLIYNQYVTINDNHGEINFDQTGSASPPPGPPKP